jgi:hypothetical protein
MGCVQYVLLISFSLYKVYELGSWSAYLSEMIWVATLITINDTAPILANDRCQVLFLNSEIITHWGDVRLNLFKLSAFIWYGFTHHLPLLSHVFHCPMYKSVVVTLQLKHGHSTDSLVLSNHQRPNKKQALLKNTNPSEFTHIFIQVFMFV